jgi:hypothetical protein
VKEKFRRDWKRKFEDHAVEDKLLDEEQYEVKSYSTDPNRCNCSWSY